MKGALVLLHGFASNSTRWWRLPAVVEDWKLLRPDLRGHAGSSGHPRIGMREWCEDITALLDAEGFERAVIGGHCLGANIAVNFAARHPARTAGLVLIEPLPRPALIGGMRRLAAIRPLLRFLGKAALAVSRLGLHRRRVETMDLEQWDRGAESGAIPLSTFASPLSDLRYMTFASYFQALSAVLEPLPELASIRCPALALLSRNSTMTDPDRTRAAMEQIREMEIVEMQAEHWIPTEQPAAMREAIATWLSRRTGPERAA